MEHAKETRHMPSPPLPLLGTRRGTFTMYVVVYAYGSECAFFQIPTTTRCDS